MIFLQVESTGLFTDIAQQGIAFGILVAIIIVLARRVMKLEKQIEQMTNDRFKEIGENTIILTNATTAMTEMAKTRCNYEDH